MNLELVTELEPFDRVELYKNGELVGKGTIAHLIYRREDIVVAVRINAIEGED